jgi:ankyrin repeat protein
MASATTTLNRAIRSGEIERALALIAPGRWLDETDTDCGDTPLCAAAGAKAEAVAVALLRAGASISAQSRNGDAPLHRACHSGDAAIARLLIDAGADINARTATNPNSIESGQTVLIMAVHGRNLALIKALVEAGADPVAKDDHGRGPADYAAFVGKRIADYLAKVIAEAADDISLFDAVRARSLPRLVALAAKGEPLDQQEEVADLTMSSGLTVLHCAVEAEWLEGVEWLLAQGVAPDIPSRHGMTPLMRLGTGKASPAIARALIAAGADCNAQSPRGITPLGAVSDPEIVRQLIAAGADPNLRDPHTGETTFLSACMMARADVVAAMIAGGADLTARDDAGRGIEFYARANARARAVINEHLGRPPSPAEQLRAQLRSLPEDAQAEPFRAFAAALGEDFARQPAPWKRRKGALYFHDVALARVYARLGEAMPEGAAGDAHAPILARLSVQAREAGACLFHLDASGGSERRAFVLLPSAAPLAPAVVCGTNGNRHGTTDEIVSGLLAIAADDPFDIYACGFDFCDAQLRAPSADPARLAARLIELCPDLATFGDVPDSTAELAAELAETGRFGLWWD